MKNKYFLAVIIFALIIAAVSLQQRFFIERDNKNVEFIIDDSLLREFKREQNAGGKNLLSLLKEHGLTGAAVHEETIEDLSEINGIWFLTGDDIARNEELTGKINPLFKQFSFDMDSAFLVVQKQSAVSRIKDYAVSWKEDIDLLEFRETEAGLLIFFPEWKSKYEELSGIDINRINQIKNNGLITVLRLKNTPINREKNRSYLEKLAPEYVIFSGDEVLGYGEQNSNSDSGTGLRETAAILKENKIMMGMIEPFIASFLGNDQLARLLDYNLVRAHSIQKEEMAKYSFDKIVKRYLRAVEERDVRLLYLKPFLEVKEGENNFRNLLELNTTFLQTLKNKLNAEGYITGGAEPFPFFSNSLFVLIILGAGIFAAGIILLEYLTGMSFFKWKWVLLFLGLLIEFMLFKRGYNILMRQVLALGSSIIFPSLAVIIGLKTLKTQKNWLFIFLKITGISLTGALLLAAALNHISFLLKVDQFRGVKLAYILPLLIISWYYFKEKFFESKYGQDRTSGTGMKKLLVKFFNYNIKIKHLLLLIFIGIAGLIYIGRTGNYSFFTVPSLETRLREILEQYLYVRPRFKEFLIGHPLLLLALGLQSRLRTSFLFYPLLLAGTIGQINLVNTFAHIHMPLLISGIRTFNGLWLGIIAGSILLFVSRNVLSFFDKDRTGNRLQIQEQDENR